MTPLHSVIVSDPSRRTRLLAEHAGLAARDAQELAAIYRALGYAEEQVVVMSAAIRRAA